MRYRVLGRGCPSYTADIEIQDEGTSLGTASQLNFVGSGVTAEKDGDKVTVTIPGADAAFTVIDYNGFEAGGGTFPPAIPGQPYRLVFNDPNNVIDKNGVQYYHNMVIIYTSGGYWLSWVINRGN